MILLMLLYKTPSKPAITLFLSTAGDKQTDRQTDKTATPTPPHSSFPWEYQSRPTKTKKTLIAPRAWCSCSFCQYSINFWLAVLRRQPQQQHSSSSTAREGRATKEESITDIQHKQELIASSPCCCCCCCRSQISISRSHSLSLALAFFRDISRTIYIYHIIPWLQTLTLPVQRPDVFEARQKNEILRSGPRDAVHARQRQDGEGCLHGVAERTAELSAPHALRAHTVGAFVRSTSSGMSKTSKKNARSKNWWCVESPKHSTG